MAAQRKIFRIEENLHVGFCGDIPAVSADDDAALRHHELMSELMTLRALLNTRLSSAQASHPETSATARELIDQAQALKGELDLIHDAIRRTKDEMGGLEVGEFLAPQMARVGRELDAVVAGTEQATQKILKSAEDIDQIANNMSSLLKGEYAQGLAQDVRDHVVHIFEASNFQDLAGQRIGNVMSTLKFIEDHINRMQQIWNNIERAVPALPVTPVTLRSADSESRFLNGPKLSGDPDHSSQADIDQIFDSN